MSESGWDAGRNEPDAGADPIAEGFEDEEAVAPPSEREAEEELLEEEEGRSGL
jgi:hypothetical protein